MPVPKPDGTIRICGDYKVTINPLLKVDQYPVSKAEDLFISLAGGKQLTKLDLTSAPTLHQYTTITINTRCGLYQYFNSSSSISTNNGEDFTRHTNGRSLH